ncbi:CAP domain-containing protein [Flagellimonas aquimarina]|jgi:uncharacterized protein YkwD|uniref:CAP domain-containing protein n=1 Tax=Flagellimonas aquimarina TaxID=2201895 RepID=A0A316L3R3_9FLAO|nr:CAP domain-containing protein [Allomuricauda koreensis]PWL40058.1 CAP domain-containing protein [Allomuricauda koreensis]
MKKIYYTFLVAISVVILSMCSKTSSVEEEKFEEALLENEKAVINPSEMETEVLGLINDYRVSIGASKLQSNSTSYQYAEEHNNYMIAQKKLSHDNFQSRASKIALETGAVDVGENVARYYTTAQLVFDGWIESASHKEAIEGGYTHTTLSITLDKDGRPYFTQIFMKVE